jgi:hypothetical protein
MKKIIPLVILLLISCNKKEIKPTLPTNNVDSIISNSSRNIEISNAVQKTSDSATEKKVIKIVKEIQYLTNFVEVLKLEKSSLLRELKVSKENVRVDTVFIETKKNFWGKEKTTINIKTDSTSIESIDTTSGE